MLSARLWSGTACASVSLFLVDRSFGSIRLGCCANPPAGSTRNMPAAGFVRQGAGAVRGWPLRAYATRGRRSSAAVCAGVLRDLVAQVVCVGLDRLTGDAAEDCSHGSRSPWLGAVAAGAPGTHVARSARPAGSRTIDRTYRPGRRGPGCLATLLLLT
jgi:hypothetical protein